MTRLYKRSSKRKADDGPDKLVFLLNGELLSVRLLNPHITLFDFLQKKLNLRGTKNGCNEGYCGACTVTVGEMKGSQMVYRSINSCNTYAASMHAKHLITIEGVKYKGKTHPAQQALISTNASQCGFCMPAMVMSMYTKCFDVDSNISQREIKDLLVGNLCRCNGYASIIIAAQKLFKRKNLNSFTFDDSDIVSQLKKTPYKKSQKFVSKTLTYHSVITTDEFAQLLQQYPKAMLVAGGTTFTNVRASRFSKSNRMISLDRIDALKVVRTGKDMITFGAGTTISDAQLALTKDYPCTDELFRRFGSLQLRNQATLIGNIASGVSNSDLSAALIVLNAKLTLRAGSFRRYLKLEDYYLGSNKQDIHAGEFIESLQIQRKYRHGYFDVFKISTSINDDLVTLCAAFYLDLDKNDEVREARICYSGMDVIPKRAVLVEQALMGKKWTMQIISEVMHFLEQDFNPSSDVNRAREVQVLTAKNLLKRFYLQTQSESIQTRLTVQAL